MLEHLRETLAHACGLQPDRRILVGVSGGPDSLCLMDALRRLGYPVIAAHFNHGLRTEASAEAQEVRRIADQTGIPFISGEADTRAFSQEHSLSIEEAGRALRYRFLFSQAEQAGAQALAVAHTADDQVETVLMHLLRGAGLSGLRGMQLRALPNAWSQSIPLVRPLLDVWRSEVLAYCALHRLHPVYDASNLDPTFFRNRIRHELIPYLETYNPAVRAVIWRSAQALESDYQVLENVIAAAWDSVVIEAGPEYIIFDLAELQAQPPGVLRQLFRKAIGHLRRELRDIGLEVINRALDFLNDPARPAQIDLVAGLRLMYEPAQVAFGPEVPARLWLAEWTAELPYGDWPQVSGDWALPIQAPGYVPLLGGWQLRSEPVENLAEARRQAQENLDPFQAWVATDDFVDRVEVRARRPGDRFQPLGMPEGSMKLSDFMINQKIPQRARRDWPLVCAGEKVIWVPGFRLGHPFRLKPDTRQAAQLSLRKVQDQL